MKITLLGVLGLVVVGAVLLYLAKQIIDDQKETLSRNPAPSPNPPDGPPRKLDSL
jgi:hypothetical protein